jgi:DNA-binding transcriptional regulator of glucitol operon
LHHVLKNVYNCYLYAHTHTGGLINKHPGNIAYRRVVDYNKAIYKQVPKRHRILVSRSIVQTIQNHGGRFLQQQTTNATAVAAAAGNVQSDQTRIVWTCIPMRRAVQKTSQALREPVVVVQQQQQQPSDESSELPLIHHAPMEMA